MIELPESKVLAKEGASLLKGLTIVSVDAFKQPHAFCWMNLEPKLMEEALLGKVITDVKSSAHYLRFIMGDDELAIGEDVMLEYKKIPQKSLKHQLSITMSNQMILEFKIKLYGFILFGQTETIKMTMPYYRKAMEAIDPLTPEFTYDYFIAVTGLNQMKGTVKQALATDQKIPGLGNGILQDILFRAKLLPKRKVNTLTDQEKINLYHQVVDTVGQMTTLGGRDVVKHFDGEPGGYEVLMKSTRTLCPICQTPLVKEAYLGGKVIYCPQCQK